MAVPKKRTTAKKVAGKKATSGTNNARVLKSPEKSYSGRRDPIIGQGVQVVDEIPAPYSSNTRVTRYARKLAEIRENVEPGQTAIVAEFIGRGGATNVKRALERGERQIDGEVGDWEFTARRLESGGSVLFATLLKK